MYLWVYGDLGSSWKAMIMMECPELLKTIQGSCLKILQITPYMILQLQVVSYKFSEGQSTISQNGVRFLVTQSSILVLTRRIRLYALEVWESVWCFCLMKSTSSSDRWLAKYKRICISGSHIFINTRALMCQQDWVKLASMSAPVDFYKMPLRILSYLWKVGHLMSDIICNFKTSFKISTICVLWFVCQLVCS